MANEPSDKHDSELIRLLHQRYQDMGDMLARKAAWRLEELTPSAAGVAPQAHAKRDSIGEVSHMDGNSAPSPTASTSRDAVIEEVAKHIEASPITYFGPDPGGVRDLRYLIVAAIRDMKGQQ